MNIGTVIATVKMGGTARRKGWNGKGLFIYYVPASVYPTSTKVAKEEFGDTVYYNDYLAIKQADGSVSTWAPSIGDVLAEDWEVAL